MTVSIIIAVKTWQNNLEECIVKCAELDYPDFEILILPDVDIKHFFLENINFKKIQPPLVIPTGQVSPATKRDMALKYAKGHILAFIDDDAYPRKDWLKNAIKNFSDSKVAAVVGPAVTPLADNLRQKVSGLIYSSQLVTGKYKYRYFPGKKQEVDDYPSCNFLVRKSIFAELGGFKTNFWPGEDTILCLEITEKLNKKIIYDPEVLVYHHRRPLFIPHLRQIANYSLHRGYFAKRLLKTSFRFSYFVPSIFLGFVILGALIILLFPKLGSLYFLGLLSYLFLVFICSLSKNVGIVFFKFFGIISTHLTYGLFFLMGLFSIRLREEL